MAERVRDVFFSLLRSALWGGELDVEVRDISRTDLGGVIKMAKSQTVLGLIAHELMTHKEFSEMLGSESRERLTLMVQENFFHYQRLNAVLLSVVLELRKHGIDPVLLKGQGISKYYPIPELRQCGDIDIYVGQENFAKSCDVIGAMSTPEDHQGDIQSLKHFHTRIGTAYIEIHRFTDVYSSRKYNLIYQNISDIGVRQNLVKLDFIDAHISTPSIDFNSFYIFNHFWHHFIADGVGLRQICDWACLLHANKDVINHDYLYKVLSEMHLLKEWQVFGEMVVDYLGLPADEMPLYTGKYKKQSFLLMGLIMREGNFAIEKHKQYKRPQGYVSGKLYSLVQQTKRDLYIYRMFPRQALKHLAKVLFGGIGIVFNDKFGHDEDR